jgi:hypothetical protein
MVRLRMCGRAPRRDLGTPVPVRPRRAPGGCRAPTCRLAPAARLRPPQGCARRKAAPAARLRPPQGCARRKAAPAARLRPPQGCAREGCVQKAEPSVDQGVDLPIRARAAHHRQDRKQDHTGLPVHLTFGPPAIGNGGQAGEKVRRHPQPPSRIARHGFRPASPPKAKRRPSRRCPRRPSQTQR